MPKNLSAPAEHEALFRLSTELLAVIGFGGCLAAANPAWEALLGFSAAELRSCLFFDLIAPEDVEAVRAALARAARGGEPAVLEARARRRDGSPVKLRWRLAASRERRLYYVAGRELPGVRPPPPGPCDSLRLTELGLVASVIAHDFNNVLTVIRGCGGILRLQPDLSPAQKQELDDLDDAVRHASDLIQQVFAHGQRKPQLNERADPNKVITQMGWMLRRLGERRVSVDVVLARDLGLVNAREVELEQVVLNLVLNARDAMPDGGPIVIETGVERCADAEHVRLAVTDQGTGIPPEIRPRLFEPFFTTKKTSTGLGLFSVQQIVSRRGGRIRVDGAAPVGTTVAVLLPRVRPDAADPRAAG